MLNLSITYIYIYIGIKYLEMLRITRKTIEIRNTHTIIFINFQECI